MRARALKKSGTSALILLTLLVFFSSCRSIVYNPLDIRKNPIYQQAFTPTDTFEFLKAAFSENQPESFYYLLSNRLREKIPFWKVSQQWDEIRNSLGEDFLSAKLLGVEFLEQSPFPPVPAARIVLQYPHPQDGFVIENFLVLLEIASDFQESRPCWRFYFPFMPYQQKALWFTLLTGKIVKNPAKINAENSEKKE